MKKQTKNIQFILLVGMIFILSSCAISKLKKQGSQYYQAGMYELASNSYLKILSKKSTDAEAKIGLMRSATLFAAQLEQDIEKNYLSGNNDNVVELYFKLQSLVKNSDIHQVPIEISDRTNGEYQEAKNRYIENYYTKALDALKKKNYSSSENLLQKVVQVVPDYKNARELLHFSICEPKYSNIIDLLKKKNFKEVYNQSHALIKIDNGYKDIVSIQQEALAAIKQIIICTSSSNDPRYRAFTSAIEGSVISSINSEKNPLLIMLQESQYTNMMNNWRNNLKNNIKIETSDIIPAQKEVHIKINNVYITTSKLTKEKKKGYIRTENSDKSVSYKKIYYEEYTQTKTVSANIYYSITNRLTKNVITSNSIRNVEEDRINYIYYNGKVDGNIVSGNWKSQSKPYNPEEDTVNDTFTSRASMRSKANGRKILSSNESMENKLSIKLSSSINRAIKGAL